MNKTPFFTVGMAAIIIGVIFFVFPALFKDAKEPPNRADIALIVGISMLTVSLSIKRKEEE